ncbi:MAG: hypothetical protein ACTSQE_15120 [Candidatus Heimdallarchaeaceae archaeon]
MQELRIHVFRYLPIIEILWDTDIRGFYSFLKSNKAVGEELKKYLKVEDKSNFEKEVFIPKLGFLKWNINRDGMIYYRTMEYLVESEQPFRPYIPLSTLSVKWKSLKTVIPEGYNSQFIISLFPQLVYELEKSFSILPETISNINDILVKTRSLCYKEETVERFNIFKSLFSPVKEIPVRMSDTFFIVESTIDTYKKTGLISNLFEAERVSRSWIKNIDKNSWLIVYGNNKPHIKQRMRTINAIKICYILSVLRNRVKFLLDNRVDEQLNLLEKLEYIEFILSVLNPDYYSSKNTTTYYLPKDYQRFVFSEVQEKIKEKKHFENVFTKVQSIFNDWDCYTQSSIIYKRNVVMNSFKRNVAIDKGGIAKPNLTDREMMMLKFLIHIVKKETPMDESYLTYFKRDKTIGAKSINYIRDNITEWLKDNAPEHVKISQNELKTQTPPKIMKSLEGKGLINITEKSETRTKRLYSINIEHPYVREELIKG